MSTQDTNGDKQLEARLYELNERLDDVRVSIELSIVLFELGERIKGNPACPDCGGYGPEPPELEALWAEHNDLAEEIYILESEAAERAARELR